MSCGLCVWLVLTANLLLRFLGIVLHIKPARLQFISCMYCLYGDGLCL